MRRAVLSTVSAAALLGSSIFANGESKQAARRTRHVRESSPSESLRAKGAQFWRDVKRRALVGAAPVTPRSRSARWLRPGLQQFVLPCHPTPGIIRAGGRSGTAPLHASSRSMASAYAPSSISPCRKRRRVWCDVLLFINVSCTWSQVQSPAFTESRISDNFMLTSGTKLYLSGSDQTRDHQFGCDGDIKLAIDKLASREMRRASVYQRIIDLDPGAASGSDGVVDVGDRQSARAT